MSRGDHRSMSLCALAALVALGAFAGAAGQSLSPPVDTTSLAPGPGARMSALLERTIFAVDVLTLDLRFGPASADALTALRGADVDEEAARDSAAEIAVAAEDAFARIRFLRGVSLDQFLDATRESLEAAVEAGMLADSARHAVARGLPRWFSFLRERGIREDDRLLYRIRGDTLRTVFIGAGGEVLLDQTDVGAQRPRAVLGGYLAPESDFREDLLDSLFRPG